MTQQGKSMFTDYAIEKSFQINQPLCYIDPKGDTYPKILARFFKTKQGQEDWAKYQDRIIFINPVSKSDYIVGFNAIQPIDNFPFATIDNIALIANSTMSHITRAYGYEVNEANRMQGIMSAAIGTMVAGGRGSLTLAELPLLFLPYKEGKYPSTINPMVTKLLEDMDRYGPNHFGTRNFWEHMWSTWNAQDRRSWVQSTLGRIEPFLFDERFLYTTCTSQNVCLDFNKIVNKGYWVFVNLPFSLLSEPETTLLGSLLISKLFQACMRRDQERTNYRLIIDEAGLYNTAPLDRILETAGAYKFWLTVIVQDLNQLYRPTTMGRDYHLRDTVLNNVSQIYSFRNDPDSELLAKKMYVTTGRVATGYKQNGDPDYLPPSAEESLNAAQFRILKKRQMIVYNKKRPTSTRTLMTPTMEVSEATQNEIAYFEARHMQLTGRPSYLIRKEIEERQAKWKTLFKQTSSSSAKGDPIYDQEI
jgi:hypothetical protein